MSSIQCFMIEATGNVQRYLRRYRSDPLNGCEGSFSYHNAFVLYDTAAVVWGENGTYSVSGEPPPRNDYRWPLKCDHCAYVFLAEDEWQLFQELVYVRKETGELTTLRDAPLGAIWNADWYPEKGPDGQALMVRTPGGEWFIDGPSSNGGGWTRTGTAPNITVRPSILQTKYHGFLTDGFLVEC